MSACKLLCGLSGLGILVLPLEQVRLVMKLITARSLIIISNFIQRRKLPPPSSFSFWSSCLTNFLSHLGELRSHKGAVASSTCISFAVSAIYSHSLACPLSNHQSLFPRLIFFLLFSFLFFPHTIVSSIYFNAPLQRLIFPKYSSCCLEGQHLIHALSPPLKRSIFQFPLSHAGTI